MNDETARDYALARLKAKNDFRTLAAVWVGVTTLLNLVWALADPGQPYWPVWPMLGIGIALAITGIKAYGPPIGYISDRDIDAEVERLTRR